MLTPYGSHCLSFRGEKKIKYSSIPTLLSTPSLFSQFPVFPHPYANSYYTLNRRHITAPCHALSATQGQQLTTRVTWFNAFKRKGPPSVPPSPQSFLSFELIHLYSQLLILLFYNTYHLLLLEYFSREYSIPISLLLCHRLQFRNPLLRSFVCPFRMTRCPSTFIIISVDYRIRVFNI